MTTYDRIEKKLVELLREDASGHRAVRYLRTEKIPENDKDILFARADEIAYPTQNLWRDARRVRNAGEDVMSAEGSTGRTAVEEVAGGE